MSAYDCIVVGLGTAGSATCMTLARRGFKVLGLDKYSPPHTMGSHHGASRSVRRAYLEGSAYVPMAMKSWELWRRLEKDSGQKLLKKTGNLTIGPPDCPAILGFATSAKTYAIPHELLSAKEIRKRWAYLSPPDAWVAGLEKEAGIVFPELGIATFLAEAEKAGAHLSMGEPLDRWSEDQGMVYVHTTRKSYECARLLISAGAWTNRLLGLANGLLMPKRVPVHWVKVPEDKKFHIGHFPVNFWQVPLDESPGSPRTFSEFYALPVTGPDSLVKVAFHNGLADCDPATLVRDDLPGDLEKIKVIIAQFLPDLDHYAITSDVCMYTLTADGHFYLGKKPGTNNVFGVGLAGHGFKFAPVLGEILADLMTGIPPAIDIESFEPTRFEPEDKKQDN